MPEDRAGAEGVTVISAWTHGDGELMIRLTMSGANGDPEVLVLSRVDEAVEVVERWLETLAARSHETS